jgi:phospholipase C
MRKFFPNRRNGICIATLFVLGGLAVFLNGCGSSGGYSGTSGGPTLTSIAVTPANGSVAQGLTQQFKATGTYSDSSTQDLTATATWSSSATTVVTIGASGLANGVGFGATTIKATSGAVSGSTSFQITASAFSQFFQHVVIIFQENRTPDNLFHGLPGADIATTGLDSSGQTITLTPTSLATSYDLNHSHSAFLAMYDNGKMDGADKVTISCAKGAVGCPPANAQFQYVNPTEVQPYFQLAETYTFGDRMFQTNQGPSFPAHQFIIAGTSADSPTSNLLASENPIVPAGAAPTGENAGCHAPAGTTVNMIDPSGSEATTMYPCFEHPTLIDSLDTQAVDWRYYAPSAAGLSIWVGPDAISHIRNGGDWNKVILNQAQVLTDIANNQLAQVTWVIPSGQASDHANVNNGTGPSWVASVVNAIGNSAYWPNTAIIITWDDWGGWYDHVPPPSIVNSYEYGFRVPLIVVSPYAKKAYVSHAVYDSASILRFIEEVFKLPSLGYADATAADLADCFDLTQAPSVFKQIHAKYGASHFLLDKTPPLPPDDDDR